MAVAQQTFEQLRTAGLAEVDPQIAELLGRELDRQRGQIELIASENFTWPSVLEAVGSVPTNKYAEGYPGKRYYGGCEVVDEIEELARSRAKELFGAEHANVQPHAGAQANMAVYFAVLEPGDRVLGLSLDHGGHLTHGLKVNFSGKLYEFHHYGVSRETMQVDYDEVLARAKEVRPKLIVCGGSAYPRTVEADKFREIADEVGALLMCDMAHFSGLVAAGMHPNPVPHCDFVTSTSHKTLAGPRAGFVLCREEHASKLDRANFPGMQGGPLMHAIAAKAVVLRIAMTDAFRDYQRQVRTNADALAAGLIDGGHDVLTGGTDTHLVQLDLRATEWTGLAAQERLEECKLTANRNTVPFDERPPMVASGVRLGTPAATMRGFDDDDFREVASIIVDALHDDADVDALAPAPSRCATSGRSTRASAVTPSSGRSRPAPARVRARCRRAGRRRRPATAAASSQCTRARRRRHRAVRSARCNTRASRHGRPRGESSSKTDRPSRARSASAGTTTSKPRACEALAEERQLHGPRRPEQRDALTTVRARRPRRPRCGSSGSRDR